MPRVIALFMATSPAVNYRSLSFSNVMKMAISLQMLQFFVDAARTRSFSAVARERYLSQAAVSVQIKRLEEDLGLPLFIRSQPRIRLTEAGEDLYQHANAVLRSVEDLERCAAGYRVSQRTVVQLAAVESIGTFLLPRIMSELAERHPTISVSLRIANTAAVKKLIENDDVDLAVSPRPRDIAGLVSRRVFREQLVVIRPATMSLAAPVSLADLARQPKVIREEGSFSLSVLRGLLSDFPGGNEYVAQVTGCAAVNEAVASGLGVSLVPYSTTGSWLREGTIAICEVEDLGVLHNDFYVTHRGERRLTPPVRAVAEYLCSALAGGGTGLPGEGDRGGALRPDG